MKLARSCYLQKVEPEGRGVRKALKTDYHQTESFLLSLLKEWKED